MQDSGLGFQVTVLKIFEAVPSSVLREGWEYKDDGVEHGAEALHDVAACRAAEPSERYSPHASLGALRAQTATNPGVCGWNPSTRVLPPSAGFQWLREGWESEDDGVEHGAEALDDVVYEALGQLGQDEPASG